MQKLGLGAVIALTVAMLTYAGVVASRDFRSAPVAQKAASRGPQDLAGRERMARLVAEVAARTAAQTAKAIALERLHRQQAQAAASPPAEAVAETTARRQQTTVN
ncbi:MAG TPA: hypothetical protein VFA75_17200 [Nevskia sp.]|nr:hypothetical protein [Nevskia sp.]